MYSLLPLQTRSVLQSLPPDVQHQLVQAIRAIGTHLSPAVIPVVGTYHVEVRDDDTGRFLKDPLRDYERGRRRITKDDLLALQGKE